MRIQLYAHVCGTLIFRLHGPRYAQPQKKHSHLAPERHQTAPWPRSGPIFMQPVMQGFDYVAQCNTHRWDVENVALQRKGWAIWIVWKRHPNN